MKFLELHLKAFGPFTDRRIALDAGPGMHLFHGPNEAGKSTILRAIRSMLYGVDRSTPDNYLHDNKELRVGGILQRSDGHQLEFLRRKGNKTTLVDCHGGALNDDALATFLGGVDQDLFMRLYGLNHETLVLGGKALLDDDGDLAQSLVSASMGPGLRAVVENLRSEAEELWRPRGKTQPVNAAIEALNDARGRISKATLLPKNWTKIVKELAKISQDVSLLEQRKQQVDKDLRQLERHQKAIPKVPRYRELKATLASLPETPDLTPAFIEQRKAQQFKWTQLQEQLKTNDIKLSRTKQGLDETPHQPDILQSESRIKALVQQIETYRSAETRLRELAASSKQLERQADSLAADLKPGATRETLSPPPAALRQQVAELAQAYRQSRTLWIKSQEEVSRFETELAALQSQLESLGPPVEVGPLEIVESRLQQDLRIDEQISQRRSEAEQQARLVARGCAQLPLWEGTAEALRELSVPLAETISEYDTRFQNLRHRQNDLLEKQTEKRSELTDLDKELLLLRGGDELPTPQELKDSRHRRRTQWDELVAHWKAGGPPSSDLLSGFERQVQESDAIADRMFQAAEQVTQRADIKRRRESLTEKLQEHELQEKALRTDHQQLQEEWTHWWLPLGEEPLSPKEMRAWLEQKKTLLDNLQRAEQSVRELSELSEKRSHLIAKVCQALNQEPATSHQEWTTLADARERLLAVLGPQKLAATQRQQWRRDQLRVEQEIQKAKAACLRAEQAAQNQHQDWARLVEQLTVDPSLEPSDLAGLLSSFEGLRKLNEQLAEWSTQREACREQKTRFEQSTAQIAQELGLEQENRDPASLAEELSRQLQTAQEHQQKRHHLNRELGELEQEQSQLQEQLSQSSAQLDRMRVEAGAARLEELPEIEQRAQHIRELLAQRDLLEAGLRELSAGQTLDTFCLEVEAADADLIPSLMAEHQATLEDLNRERDDLRVRQGELQAEQRQSNGSDNAAEAAADAQEALARTQSGVERYMVLSLAEHLLSQEIERYRKNHQGPLVELASESFAKLTLGIYPRLEIGFDDKDKPILQACERENRKVGISGLSDGTRDQLFLALRLAAIELGLQQREPIPFVADDLLVHFDQQRAGAGLELLADFSQKTQVLFFTHLDRDRDLALRILGERVKVHQLQRALGS